ncbi:MAG2960 family serine endopeptidase lipoprotein [Mycoplasmopsis agalactiae]|uniref:DUF31 domain-containing protein n=1 Tax=Mycoplasmopsis agalactiae TaxID=2110 RepID=D3VQQ4_MYCAA|nr:DUF31 family protein [Mycoplasmopsis agalactiae]KAB6718535.1 hypothetical protein E4L58_02230 [Mycoplasmopsis agalactiae]CBH40649.1 Conserved hypothetical protein [Mycoplasmopsis agalactiae]
MKKTLVKSKGKFKLLLGTISSTFPLTLVISCTIGSKKQDDKAIMDRTDRSKIIVMPSENPELIKPKNIDEITIDNNSDSTIKQADKHFLSFAQLKNMTPREIHQKTKTYNEAKSTFLKYLKANATDYVYENKYDFSTRTNDSNYFKHVKPLGEYGNVGDSKDERTKFFNPRVPLWHNLSQKYLEKFNTEDVKDLNPQSININDVIKINPFGFLPSNLSQLFYYASFESLENLFNIKNIKNIKAVFDDVKGTFELLIFAGDHKYYLRIKNDGKINKSLKKNSDFFQYINDRSIELNINQKVWVDEFVESTQKLDKRLNFSRHSGTAWVIDRIKNTDPDSYEFLLATNIHVFSLRKTFDKSLHTNGVNDTSFDSRWNEFPPGFYDGVHATDTSDNRSTEQYFRTNRIAENKIDDTFGIFELSKHKYINNNSKYVNAFEAYSQYLSAPYYVPRYETEAYIKGEKIDLNNVPENNAQFTTKNSGADFVTLRFKIKKDKLKDVLPKLSEIIDTDTEKDWYINFKKDKFSPLSTQFYAGYSRFWDPFVTSSPAQFRGIKSTGGLISTKRRIIDEHVFRDVWLKYDSELNKEYNSLNDHYKKYEKPFLKDNKEHGMPLTIVDQFSTLYTDIPFGELNLEEGASGSMVIDSSFNVIGILNTSIEDIPGSEMTYLPLSNKDFERVIRKRTNGVVLFQSLSYDYNTKDNKPPHIFDGLIDKLKTDKLETVKFNPKDK